MVLAQCVTATAVGLGRLRDHGNVPGAVAVALLSTVCYASSAVVQQQEASRPDVREAGLIGQLLRRPRWWMAIVGSLTAALLHVVALALGPLSVVQPLGVLTLVLALPLGARWADRRVTPAQWRAAAAVVVGVAAFLAAAPHRGRPIAPGVLPLPAAMAALAALVVVLVVVSARLPAASAPVARAAAAATCFGSASAMTRVAAIGAAPLPVAGALAVVGAAAGFGLAQAAYRHGGLGAPLATLILVDPLVAVVIGVIVLGEPAPLSPIRITVGALGLAATATGIWSLAHQAEATLAH
jgi:drug/metabolite transporter (DMT)-like permease